MEDTAPAVSSGTGQSLNLPASGAARSTGPVSSPAARGVGTALNIAAVVLALAALLLRHFAASTSTRSVVVGCLALIPLLAILLLVARRGRATVGQFAFAVLAPSLALGYVACMDYELLDWRVPILTGAGAGIVLAAIVALVDRSMRGVFSLLALAATLTSYGFGAVVEANGLMDSRPPDDMVAYVVDEFPPAGWHITPRLQLSAGGPWRKPHMTRVSISVFHALGTGDGVLLSVHKGRFGMKWSTVTPTEGNVGSLFIPDTRKLRP